jgi:hypothetical protein
MLLLLEKEYFEDLEILLLIPRDFFDSSLKFSFIGLMGFSSFIVPRSLPPKIFWFLFGIPSNSNWELF